MGYSHRMQQRRDELMDFHRELLERLLIDHGGHSPTEALVVASYCTDQYAQAVAGQIVRHDRARHVQTHCPRAKEDARGHLNSTSEAFYLGYSGISWDIAGRNKPRTADPAPAHESLVICSIFVTIQGMQYEISYYNEAIEAQVLALPETLLARYFYLTDHMEANGPNLGPPHTKALGDGLLELRLKGAEGIARVMYCTLIGRRIVMLHSFIKKTDKTPAADMALARKRLKEIKNADT